MTAATASAELPTMQLTLSSRLYRDPQAYERERTTVFAAGWQFLGHDSEVPNPGDYLAGEVAGWPVLAVRGADATLRGFHNVCRHRAGPLVADGRGSCGTELTCRYHGWRYALDGRLRSAVDFGAAEGFDPREFGLHPVRIETWRGFVFVNLDQKAGPLSALVAPLERMFAERGLTLAPATLRRSHDIACNWKTYVENYLEGYHIPVVHPALAEEVETDGYRVRMDGAVAVHEVPTRSGVNDGLWAWIWPNLAFNVYRYGLMVEHMRPIGHAKTRLDYLYFYDPAIADMDAVLAASNQLTAEDVEICEAVQRNLDAGIYETGVLSPRHEDGVAWFQTQVAEALAPSASA
ncbi:aromatic ring-hydroxylating dioxygenase subunit alpha [Phenylobacterium aquaticum]|uniref:aromatic ring-hydroxylating oxygenase subunit alpha n=2 Tax=Phenylobacterium aquaticum TaxID=1763816 RepID=UPI0026F36E44|nr:SRPBCC family protein [Phenylobacterium aquaticum]